GTRRSWSHSIPDRIAAAITSPKKKSESRTRSFHSASASARMPTTTRVARAALRATRVTDCSSLGLGPPKLRQDRAGAWRTRARAYTTRRACLSRLQASRSRACSCAASRLSACRVWRLSLLASLACARRRRRARYGRRAPRASRRLEVGAHTRGHDRRPARARARHRSAPDRRREAGTRRRGRGRPEPARQVAWLRDGDRGAARDHLRAAAAQSLRARREP